MRRGMQAEVLGPATDGSHDLQVMFKGHRAHSNIFRHEVSLEKPEDQELTRLGDGSYLPNGFTLAVVEEPATGKCRRPAVYGDKAEIQYVGYEAREEIVDGASIWKKRRKIAETVGRKGQVKVHIGAKKALEGIELALLGMCPGEKRKVRIPPNLGFGGQHDWKEPRKKILAKPEEATLIYVIRMMELKKGKKRDPRNQDDSTTVYLLAFGALVVVVAGSVYLFRAGQTGGKGKGRKNIPIPKKKK